MRRAHAVPQRPRCEPRPLVYLLAVDRQPGLSVRVLVLRQLAYDLLQTYKIETQYVPTCLALLNKKNS